MQILKFDLRLKKPKKGKGKQTEVAEDRFTHQHTQTAFQISKITNISHFPPRDL